MQNGLATIIGKAIGNLGQVKDTVYDTNIYAMKVMASHLIEAIEKMEQMWPDLSKDEKQEIKATIEFIKTAYLIPDEEIINRVYKK